MNILVTGANGQLGSEIKALEGFYKAHRFVFTDVNELDISNKTAIVHFISENNINAIVNCAAYTAVDKAETEQEQAYKINCDAVVNLAQAAKERNLILIHVSTDYVFDGMKNVPYNEADATNPIGVYGKSKLAGESKMLEINPRGLIIRTSWLYSSFGNNFVKTMLRLGKERTELGVVCDQVGTPTYAADLAKAILDILPKVESNRTDILHYSNEGVCSWYDFAHWVFKISDCKVKLNAIATSEFPTPTKRPEYSVLSKRKIKSDYGIEIPHWSDSLEKCLAILRQNA
ncbi:MAG TPA: dTDP-4-dehydrorhamnose reductase [Bacteroidales bacterium]|nr:dTDP-4-dehydrorhamnose reductase [Bacteroidales bacterium]